MKLSVNSKEFDLGAGLLFSLSNACFGGVSEHSWEAENDVYTLFDIGLRFFPWLQNLYA